MLVTFGEIMMRLSPPGHLRFSQARIFDVTYGGGEANVAVGAACLGLSSRFVTRLPDNDLGRACSLYVSQYGVDTSHIIWGGERLGIYFYEVGAVQRGSKVVYDRTDSALATIELGMVNWEEIFDGANWFHFTGITPAVSENAYAACLKGVQKAKDMGLTVSCDLNYRAKLWKWGKRADQIMSELVELTDVVVGNEEDADKVFGIKARDVDIKGVKVNVCQYRDVVEKLVKQFPNIKKVAFTLRGSINADHNQWSSLYFDGKKYFQGKTYQITHLVDRVGGGDSFVAGLIYGLNTFPEDSERVVEFATAASCLKHTVVGDFNLVTQAEVEKLMQGDASGRVAR